MVRRSLLAAAVLAAAVPLARTADGPALPDGLYRLSTVGPLGESAVCVVKVDAQAGTAVVVANPPTTAPAVTDLKAADGKLSFTLSELRTFTDPKGNLTTFDAGSRTFEAGPPGNGKAIRGSLGTDRFATRAVLTPTDKAELGPTARGPAAELYERAVALERQPLVLQSRARAEKDQEKKAALMDQVAAARKEAEKIPGLYRELIQKHPDSPAAADAAQALVRGAERAKVTPAEALDLAKRVTDAAAPYGPRLARMAAVEAADNLVRAKGLAGAALGPITPVAQALTEKDPAATRFDILTTYKTALEAAGRNEEAKQVGTKLVALDAELDKEYLATVPPFKPDPAAGRKDAAANRVAVLELFTGAQCPPCVAADVAFDALAKTYKEGDVVLLQYHLHIPGPDPLTNRDTVARAGFYKANSTPSTFFNGKPAAGGGGGMANARDKYDQYRGLIDPILGQSSPVKVTGTATRAGDKLEVAAEVAGAPAGARLRLVVTEESIKYVGSNRLRFHHHVVRAMPGGADGVEVKEGSFRHAAAVDLAEVRKGLTAYLDEYAANERPFPKADRPMAMDKLGVVALVQDDATGEILQAAHIEVKGK